jgi:hypothetical protein
MASTATPDRATVGGEPVDTSTGEVLAVVRSERKTAMLRPIAQPGEILAVQNETRAFVAAALTEGRDFGTFPGVDKKSLFKAGAERVCAAFAVYPRYRIVEKEVDHDREVKWRKVKNKYDWSSGKKGAKIGEDVTEGISLGLYRYVVQCELVSRESDLVVGSAIASCSTMESKYIDRPRDAENTALQMAEKRAHVAATRTAFGLSEEFTQDIEENPDLYRRGDDAGAGAAAAEPSEPQPNCPKCSSRMWDNRKNKKNPKAPDFKCRDTKCDGIIWPGQWPPKDARAAGSGSAKPGPALGDAKALRFPLAKGKPEHGKPLADLTDEYLGDVAAWITESEERKTQHGELLAAIGVVLADREQGALPLDAKAPAGAAGSVPPAGKVSDALAPAKQLADDDEIPF